MTNATSCCANRASEYPHARVADIPEMARALVDVTVPGAASHRTYRCRLCGQAWEEFRIPRPEPPDDFRVVKVGWASSAASGHATTPAVPQTRAPAADRPTSSRRAVALFTFLASSACLFYALWFLPPFATGKAWVARWIVAGLLVALALQSVFSLLRKRPARRG